MGAAPIVGAEAVLSEAGRLIHAHSVRHVSPASYDYAIDWTTPAGMEVLHQFPFEGGSRCSEDAARCAQLDSIPARLARADAGRLVRSRASGLFSGEPRRIASEVEA